MSQTDSPDPATPAAGRPAGWMRRMRWPIMIGAIALVIAAALFIYLTGGRFENTDDAQVQAARVSVSSSISGRVLAVNVREGQFVKAGDILFRIDARPFEAVYNEAQANVAAARLQVMQLKAAYRQHLADLKAAQESLAYLQGETVRQKALVVAGTSTQAEVAKMASQTDQARQQVAAQQQAVDNALAALGGNANIPVDQHPLVLQALARASGAGLNRGYVDVKALQDGTVTKVEQLQVGDTVNANSPLFDLVPPDVWIEANFKENQLEYMRPGQTATVKLDAYPDRRFKAVVQSISPGTGSSFSLLPAENATGNWVKVTQRVPVRLVFVGKIDAPLEAGLSASVTVDTLHKRHLFAAKAPNGETAR
jgi:membrane fusion protein (multidrug efflux system)